MLQQWVNELVTEKITNERKIAANVCTLFYSTFTRSGSTIICVILEFFILFFQKIDLKSEQNFISKRAFSNSFDILSSEF